MDNHETLIRNHSRKPYLLYFCLSFFSFLFSIGAVSLPLHAARSASDLPSGTEIVASGTCCSNGAFEWTLDNAGVLKVSGSGNMTISLAELKARAWEEYKEQVQYVWIDDGVTSVEMMDDLPNLKDVFLADSVTKIGNGAFNECTSLKEMQIPDAVTVIGSNAFNGCTALTEVLFPENITEIGSTAFQNCTSLSHVQVPKGVTTFGDSIFAGCTDLSSVEFPTDFTRIPQGFFKNCSSLTEVTIPSSVTGICLDAFTGCDAMTELYIPSSVTTITNTDEALSGIKRYLVDDGNTKFAAQDGVLLNKNKDTILRYPGGKIQTEYTVPEGVTTIDGYSFRDAANLKSITIPGSAESVAKKTESGKNSWSYITAGVFYYCSSLEEITVDDANATYASSEGVLFTKDMTELLCYPPAKEAAVFEIPEGTEIISRGAFYWNSHIRQIHIPETLTEIKPAAISGCSSMKELEIPATVTSIGAFSLGFNMTENQQVFVLTTGGLSYLKQYMTDYLETIHDSTFTIYGEAGSEAESYATTYEVAFIEESLDPLYEVSFENVANPIDSLCLHYGDSYGTLPTPKKNNSEFIGWFTQQAGGDQVSDGDIFLGMENTVLYAHWRTVYSGQAGASATWAFYPDDGSLIISGSGEANYKYGTEGKTPWNEYQSRIKTVVVQPGITSIYGLNGCKLLEEVEIGPSVKKIEYGTFSDDPLLSRFTVSSANQYYYVENNALIQKENYTLLKYPAKCSSKTFQMPTVNYVDDDAFDEGASFEQLIISKSIVAAAFSGYPFRNCSKLESVTVSSGIANLKSIDGVVYRNDTTLVMYPPGKKESRFEIPEQVTNIERFAFNNNPNLSELALPDGLTILEAYAVSTCPLLTEIKIPETVTNIGKYAYGYNLEVITYLTPEEIQEQEPDLKNNKAVILGRPGSAAKTYADEYGITFQPICQVSFSAEDGSFDPIMISPGETFGVLPSPVKENVLFEGWYTKEDGGEQVRTGTVFTGSEDITLYAHWMEGSSGKAGESATWTIFTDNKKLVISGSGKADEGEGLNGPEWEKYRDLIESVEIQEGITYVYGLSNCQKLKSVSIPSTIGELGETLFSGDSALTDIEVSDSNEKYMDIEGILFDKECKTLLKYPAARALEDYIMPDSVTTLGKDAFADGASCTSITIGAGLTELGDPGMFQCQQLKELLVDGRNNTFSSVGGVLLDKTGRQLFQYPSGKEGETYELPDSVEVVKAHAFFANDNLRKIVLPKTLKTMDTLAISGCSKLLQLDFPDSVEEIGDFAFGFTFYRTDHTVEEVLNDLPGSKYSGLSIKARPGSAAETYAHKHDIEFLARYRISFEGMDETVDAFYRYVGEIYGILPEPVKEGYLFKGWYTDAEGGTRVTGDDKVDLTSDQVLYARWRLPSQFTIDQLSYSFENVKAAFGYGEGNSNIPWERYTRLFGQNNKKAKLLFESKGEWTGCCFGMSASSELFNVTGNDSEISDFNASAHRISEMQLSDRSKNLGMTLQEYIEMLHIMQDAEPIQKARRGYSSDAKKGYDNLNELAALAEKSPETGQPVLVILSDAGCHAFLAYDLVETQGDEDRLMVYDSNYPLAEKYISLRKGADGKYQGWTYDDTAAGIRWRSTEKGSWISYIPYDLIQQEWAKRGKVDSRYMIVASACKNFTVYDAGKKILVGSVMNGRLETNSLDIVQITRIGDSATGAEDSDEVLLYLPAGDRYTIVNEDRSAENLEVSLANAGQSSTVKTESANISFKVDDNSQVNDVSLSVTKGQKYEIIQDSNLNNAGARTVKVTGVGSGTENVAVKQTKGILTVNASNASVVVDGKTQTKKTTAKKATTGGTDRSFKDAKKGYNYRVIKKNKEVAFTGMTRKTVKVLIPDKVRYKGVTYKITSISANALKGNKKVKRIVIGANVNKIGRQAFFKCKKLKTLIIKSKKLKAGKVGAKAFKGTPAKMTVKVPKKVKKVYKKWLIRKGVNKKAVIK